MNRMLERLSKEFHITDIIERKPGLTTIKVDKDLAETLIRELRDREGFTHLNFMTAIDRIEEGLFTLVYMLHNYADKSSLSVHVDIDTGSIEPAFKLAIDQGLSQVPAAIAGGVVGGILSGSLLGLMGLTPRH